LVDSVVDPHEVGFFSELGDDLSRANALSLTCDRCDRHEALLRGGVYSALDRLESFRKVADGEVVVEAPTTFVALPVAFTSSVSVCRSPIGMLDLSVGPWVSDGDVPDVDPAVLDVLPELVIVEVGAKVCDDAMG
jgi:hypothetical protein